ncbi:universal stress protein [Mycolicibacterium sp. 120266]|jgi:nucleotide-binding universal stress UspA family protein|uniref:universal stress protein n=1 Tax=Mycolicibacterium sp. 120266 TaxID=3090601 RepID=UPI00299D9B5A|nr:universal stress protein [Mycolicibacterium sp. 120266]MDX1873451.1 universal stress protein [Mycolicibacterium sp. 120266]
MIVIGYTADQFGQAALEHGLREARLRDADVLVINATKGEALADPGFAQSGALHHLEEHLAASGVRYQVSQPVGADPVDELLDAMDRPAAELLVIGIRHRNPVGKLLLGSVSQQLLLECRKPVLAVKPADG